MIVENMWISYHFISFDHFWCECGHGIFFGDHSWALCSANLFLPHLWHFGNVSRICSRSIIADENRAHRSWPQRMLYRNLEGKRKSHISIKKFNMKALRAKALLFRSIKISFYFRSLALWLQSICVFNSEARYRYYAFD